MSDDKSVVERINPVITRLSELTEELKNTSEILNNKLQAIMLPTHPELAGAKIKEENIVRPPLFEAINEQLNSIEDYIQSINDSIDRVEL